jgi:autotransporter-associated beta strand protein
MKPKNILAAALGAAILSLGLIASRAQTAANWIGPASGGEWNTAADWSTLMAPGNDVNQTTNAFIGVNTNVSYNLPMVAASFGTLTNYGVLNVNTNGFNCSAIYANLPGGTIDVVNMTNRGSVVTVNNAFYLGTNGQANLGVGASLTAFALNVAAGETSHTAGTSTFTNNGGAINVTSTTISSSGVTGTGRFVILGGTNNLGNTSIGRYASASASSLGAEGLAIYGGVVTMTNLNVSAASYGTAYIDGGTVTNFGNVTINGATAGRYLRVIQAAGLFVVPDPSIIYENSTTAGTETARYQVTGGTNFIGGMYLGASNSTVAATVTATVGGVVYVGSQGIATNGAVISTFTLSGGGMFGATAPWTGSANMSLGSGSFTFQTADPNNNPNNITLSGILSGTGALNLTGGGTLTLGAANTYSGNTIIRSGTLALGAGASLTSPQILLGSGTTFDVSQVTGYTLSGSQTLSGFGIVTGAVTAATSATIYPGSNIVTGTLTFTNGLTENGGVNNQFNLSSNPAGPNNDFINSPGGLTLSGNNNITISGALANGGVYPLISYGSSLSGGVANLTVIGAVGTLSNSPTAQTIYFINSSSFRASTNVVWIGNATANNWDIENTTNWLDNGVGAPDYFVPGDNTLFSNLGAANSSVNISGTIIPGSVTVNTTSNYTFTGNGILSGLGSLTVSNGSLTVLTTNNYVGQTILAGGVLSTPLLANGGSPSGIGAATVDPSGLIFNGGTLGYFGATTSIDHGMTFTNGGGTIDVTNGTTLTLNGPLVGNGVLTLVDSGTLTLTNANTYSGGTVVSNGVLNLVTSATPAGSGTITLSGGNLSLGAIKPANTINVAASSSITGGSSGGLTGISKVTGSANLGLSVTVSSGVFDLTGDMSTYSGTISFTNAGGAVVRFNGAIGSPLATWDLGAGPMDLNVRTSSTSNNIGALRGASSTTLSGRGGSSNNGSTTHYIGANNLNSTFDGLIQNGSGGTSSTTAIDKIGSGTLTLSGSSTYTGNTTISSGTLALINNPTNSSDGSINSSATINLVSGAMLDVSGRSDFTFQLGSSATQTLEGRGAILGNLTVNGSGTVAPGGGPGGNTGTLTVTNAVTLGGTAWMKLNRANTPNSDQVVSSLSTVTYGGTLLVTNIGAALHVGDTFTLFSGGGLSGSSFGSITLPNYYYFDTSQLGVNGTITVTNAFKPALSSVDFSGLASSGTIVLNATNGAANGPITVLTSTNLALPLSSWTSNSVTAFDGSGNLTGFSITVDPAAPQLFISLQVN